MDAGYTVYGDPNYIGREGVNGNSISLSSSIKDQIDIPEHLGRQTDALVHLPNKVEAFSTWVFKKTYSSDWLYPSNCAIRRVDQRNISSISDTEIILSGRKKIESLTNRWLYKPLRAFGRFIVLTAMTKIAATMGFIYHGSIAILYGAVWLKNGDRNFGNAQKAKDHINALLTDLTISLTNIYLICAYYETPLIFQFNIGKLIFLFAGAFFFPLLGSFSCKEFLFLIFFKNECPGVYKAIFLKNEFGIAKADGNWLDYDIHKDTKKCDDSDEWLNYQKINFEIKILKAIHNAQCKLPKFQQLSFEKSILHNNFDVQYVINEINKSLSESEHIQQKSRNIWISDLRQLVEDRYITIKLIQDLYKLEVFFKIEIRELSVIFPKMKTCQFNLDLNQCAQFFNNQISLKEAFDCLWQIEVIKCQQKLIAVEPKKLDADTLYNKFRMAILDKSKITSYENLILLAEQGTYKENCNLLETTFESVQNKKNQEEAKLLYDIFQMAKIIVERTR